MKKMIVKFLACVFALFIIDYFMDAMTFESFKSIAIVSVTLGVCNILIKPVLKFFTFAINIISLGLFSFVINAVILQIAFRFTEGAHLNGFVNSIIAAILLSIISSIAFKILD